MGSVTKPFTAAGVLRLVEAGRFSLDDRAAPLIDRALLAWNGTTLKRLFPDRAGAIERATIRHFLGMQAGLNDIDDTAAQVGESHAMPRIPRVQLAHPLIACFSHSSLIQSIHPDDEQFLTVTPACSMRIIPPTNNQCIRWRSVSNIHPWRARCAHHSLAKHSLGTTADMDVHAPRQRPHTVRLPGNREQDAALRPWRVLRVLFHRIHPAWIAHRV